MASRFGAGGTQYWTLRLDTFKSLPKIISRFDYGLITNYRGGDCRLSNRMSVAFVWRTLHSARSKAQTSPPGQAQFFCPAKHESLHRARGILFEDSGRTAQHSINEFSRFADILASISRAIPIATVVELRK